MLHRGSHFLFSCSCLLSDNGPQCSCVHLLCLIIFIFIWYPLPQTFPFSDRVLGFWFLFRFASHELDKIPRVESSVDTDWHAQSLAYQERTWYRNWFPEIVFGSRGHPEPSIFFPPTRREDGHYLVLVVVVPKCLPFNQLRNTVASYCIL